HLIAPFPSLMHCSAVPRRLMFKEILMLIARLRVNQHRSGTPLLIRFNSLTYGRKFRLGWGRDRRRSGPHRLIDFLQVFARRWPGFDRGPTWVLSHTGVIRATYC